MGMADQIKEKAQQLQERARRAMSGQGGQGGQHRREGGGGPGQGDLSQRGRDMRGSALDEDREDRGDRDR
ncbi:hypothetical protein [Streptomyces sp. NPDC127098]|uniref:hypothetical protein n=1 Tax=Streptomyces sp. NPDC127098 TaxID=3347137 RepID=UPI00364BCBFA